MPGKGRSAKFENRLSLSAAVWKDFWTNSLRKGTRKPGANCLNLNLLAINGRSLTMNEVAYLDQGGRFVVPARFRKQMGWALGDKLSLEVVDNELRVISVKQAIRSAQELVARRVPAGVSLVEELIRERREEARREQGGSESLSGTEIAAARDMEAARG
jgi:bifunctional DNA-binding transcriptional regulator/antitoxin component of YhaV-PrlF toxin-antitoxin module